MGSSIYTERQKPSAMPNAKTLDHNSHGRSGAVSWERSRCFSGNHVPTAIIASLQQRQQQVTPTYQPAAFIPRNTIACVILAEFAAVFVALEALDHYLANLMPVPVTQNLAHQRNLQKPDTPCRRRMTVFYSRSHRILARLYGQHPIHGCPSNPNLAAISLGATPSAFSWAISAA
jgi:hypothetical protein